MDNTPYSFGGYTKNLRIDYGSNLLPLHSKMHSNTLLVFHYAGSYLFDFHRWPSHKTTLEFEKKNCKQCSELQIVLRSNFFTNCFFLFFSTFRLCNKNFMLRFWKIYSLNLLLMWSKELLLNTKVLKYIMF